MDCSFAKTGHTWQSQLQPLLSTKFYNCRCRWGLFRVQMSSALRLILFRMTQAERLSNSEYRIQQSFSFASSKRCYFLWSIQWSHRQKLRSAATTSILWWSRSLVQIMGHYQGIFVNSAMTLRIFLKDIRVEFLNAFWRLIVENIDVPHASYNPAVFILKFQKTIIWNVTTID